LPQAFSLWQPASLQPASCSVGERPFVYPLEEINFSFNTGIQLLGGAYAEITCEGQTVASAVRMETANYESPKHPQGILVLYFDKQELPKGKHYTLVVASGSISMNNDATVTNSAIKRQFYVPGNLGDCHIGLEQGSVIATASQHSGLPDFCWNIESGPAASYPHFILCREERAVRYIPAHITWSRDLGRAHPVLEETLNFENGVNYSLVLPAGIAQARYRGDIVNDEVVFNFIGGHTGPIPPLSYKWCNLFTTNPDILGIVTFTYDIPVTVAENGVIQLWYADGSEMVKEAAVYVDTTVNCFVVAADFGGVELNPYKTYTLIIPEGTVIAGMGDPVFNPRHSIPVDSSTGIGNATLGVDRTPATIYDLNGYKIQIPAPGQIYLRRGKKSIGTGK